MTKWYYTKVRKLSDGSFLGWVGASDAGSFQARGSETDDPSQIRNVYAVGLYESDGKTYLRAPAYHAHGSASIGGSGDNGYYAAWKWGDANGYPVTMDARGTLRQGPFLLSLYVYAGNNDGSWEATEGTAVTLEFFRESK